MIYVNEVTEITRKTKKQTTISFGKKNKDTKGKKMTIIKRN